MVNKFIILFIINYLYVLYKLKIQELINTCGILFDNMVFLPAVTTIVFK